MSAKRRAARVAVCLGCIVAVCLGCVGLGWFLRRPAPAPSPVILHPSAAQVAVTQKHLAALDQTASRPGPRILRLSETDLNVILATSKPIRRMLTSRGVGTVQIVLQEPNALIIHASVRGHMPNVLIRGTLIPDSKTGLRFAVSDIQAERFPLPPALISAQASQVTARLSLPMLRRLSLTVQSVSVQKKELVIIGVPAAASPQSKSPAHR